MIMPIFPKLTADAVPRLGKALDKARNRDIEEAAFVEFFSGMVGLIYEDIVGSPRVKSDFDRQLPPLVGKKFCLEGQGPNPWAIEVVPLPQVLSVSLATKEDIHDYAGLCGDYNTMKAIILGSSSTLPVIRAVTEGKLKTINASVSNPAVLFQQLFSLLGPTLDRKDLTQKAVAKAMPTIDKGLREFSC